MPDIVGVRFRSCGKIYDFETNGTAAELGDQVVVESEFGIGIGKVVKAKHSVASHDLELKKILRIATEDDLRQQQENNRLEQEARAFCAERIMARGLPMKLVGAESTLDRRRIIFYFTADGRIDFRELVKDLAAKFKTRIEMRQIGIRDEAKIVGGLGICGRDLCCATFLTFFAPISIKMAKKQELVLNVGKLSGLCSRLKCCLRYEHDGCVDEGESDDAIPIDVEDAPIEVIEEKISTILSKPIEEEPPAPQNISGYLGHEKGLDETSGHQAPQKEQLAEQGGQKQKSRHKRRRRRHKK